MEKVNLSEKFAQISDHFNPRIAGELGGQQGCQPWQVKLVKVLGEFVWHHHDNEDELFYVVSGSLEMHLETGIIPVYAGEFIIIPRGTEHKPVAREEVELMLFEPASTLNTGNIVNERTVTELKNI